MKRLLFIVILYIFYTNVLSDDESLQASRVLTLSNKNSKSPSQRSIAILNARKYLKSMPINLSKKRTKKRDRRKDGYSVFPPIVMNQQKIQNQNIPDSPYFSLKQNVEQKPRFKKVIPDYGSNIARSKRSADVKKSNDDEDAVKKHGKNKIQESKINRTKNSTIVRNKGTPNKSSTKKDIKTTQLSKGHNHFRQIEEIDKNIKNSNGKNKTLDKKFRSRAVKRQKDNRAIVKKVKNKNKKSNKNKPTEIEIELKYTRKPAKKHLQQHQKSITENEYTKPSNSKGTQSKRDRKTEKFKKHVTNKKNKKVEARRLIAARDAMIEDYPYMVSIQKNHEHWCAGALLNQRLVITTANCLWKSSRVSRLRVRAGSRNVDFGGQMAKIQEVMKHPQWSIRKGPDNDVALILLDRNIKFSDKVHGVDLPNRVMLPPFDDAWVTSWGAERRDGVFVQKGLTLQVYHARLMDRKKCNNVTQRYGITVSNNFICLAQTGRRAPCTRDTGAPAVSDGILWGLASWGIRKLCGTERFPAMFSYTASQSNLDFIANATHFLMAEERQYPFMDKYPMLRAATTTASTSSLPIY